jgi:hypothetical protein
MTHLIHTKLDGTNESPRGPTYFEAHKWIHVAFNWLDATKDIFINGVAIKPAGVQLDLVIHNNPLMKNIKAQILHPDNCIRLGECSSGVLYPAYVSPGAVVPPSRNGTAMSTLDELYMWKGTAVQPALDIFYKGRYCNIGVLAGGGLYTSAPVSLSPAQGRKARQRRAGWHGDG